LERGRLRRRDPDFARVAIGNRLTGIPNPTNGLRDDILCLHGIREKRNAVMESLLECRIAALISFHEEFVCI